MLQRVIDAIRGTPSRPKDLQLYDGPLNGQWTAYIGERFRTDARGVPTYEWNEAGTYVLTEDHFSERLYYVWYERKPTAHLSSLDSAEWAEELRAVREEVESAVQGRPNGELKLISVGRLRTLLRAVSARELPHQYF